MTTARPTYDELLARVAQLEQRQQHEAGAHVNREMFEASPHVMWVFDSETLRFLSVNDAAVAKYGYSQDEFLSLTIAAIRPAEDIPYLHETLARAAGQPGINLVPARHRTKDGRLLDVEIVSHALTFGGRPARLIVAYDLTERRRAEAQLRTMAEMLDTAPGSITVHTPQGRFLYANRKTCEIHGYDDMTEFMALDLRELDVPATAELIGERMRMIAEHGEARFEVAHYRKDRSTVRLEVFVRQVVWAGAPALLSIASDITERQRTMEQLRQSEHALREAQRLAHVGSWYWLVATDVVQWSEELYRINGCDPGLPAPRFAELSSCYTAESWQRLSAAVAKALQSGEPYALELEIVRPDRTTRLTFAQGEVQHDAGGRVVGLLGSVQDITERKQLQARVAQADRLASMGMLAAGVAHEINNPLASVLYNVESLAQDLPRICGAAKRCCLALREQVGESAFTERFGEDDEILQPAMLEGAVDLAREALQGTTRIRDVARGLGTFSRVESTALARVDLQQAIGAAVKMAQNEIRYRAQLVKDFGAVPAIWASEGKLSQVFLNLLINAAHAIDEGDVENNRITIRTWTVGDEVCAEVADTGRGIAPDDLTHIFEPFFTTAAGGKGSGLGLAISRNIIIEFGGDIRVESEVGQGTRFVVRLPVKADVQEQPDKAVVEGSAPVVRGRILVVDDEESIRKALTRLLGRNHEVVSVASGGEGQVLLEKDQAFDLILCDLMMPKMTGMDLHDWLARHHPALSRQLVFITGGAFTPRAAEYLKSVGNLQLEKPFNVASLRKMVSELIAAAKRGP